MASKISYEKWFYQQGFEGTSWNYVLDLAEIKFKCSFNSEMNDEERLIHDYLYKLWNKLKEEEEEEEEDCAECCHCGEDVSNDDGEGKQVDGEYWCVDCVEHAHQCELCKKHVQETEYLPSKEDEEKQQILGNDYCLECYKKVEKFEFVENIV